MSPRASLIVAGTLVVVGALRFVTDTLHELDADYWRALEGSWLRYVVRAPSDGTVAGWLNAQCFKVLSIPSGISLIYLRNRFFDAGPAEVREAEFRDWAVRGVWVAMFFAGFTVIELQKQFGVLELSTRLVAGEDAVLNHGVHVLSAGLAWKLGGAFAMGPSGAAVGDARGR